MSKRLSAAGLLIALFAAGLLAGALALPLATPGCGSAEVADQGATDVAADRADAGLLDVRVDVPGDRAADQGVDRGGDAVRADAGPDAADAAGGDLLGGAQVTVAPGGQLIFSPAQVTIQAGQTVTWTWASSGHTVNSGTTIEGDDKFCSPNDMNCGMNSPSDAGATYSHTFTTPGTYPYFCRPHFANGMKGTIVVQ